MGTDQVAGMPAMEGSKTNQKMVFVGCFVALVATAFAFIIRVMVMGDWQVDFALSETQKGEIFGAGLWPFGVSIVLFSLVIDRIGYAKSMIFAFACHVASAILLFYARGYWDLYLGSCLNGLAAGTVEAVINPAVATMYKKNKTKMLTILHAGWPGGFVLGGLLILAMGKGAAWQPKVGIILVPTVLYGLMMFRCKFPANERVAAGVPFKDMLRECGILGAVIVVYMIAAEFGRIFGWPAHLINDVTLFVVFCFGIYTLAFGRPMYTFLLLVMILLAITELGTDAWIKELMKPAMGKIGLDAGWIIIYTATIMMVLRFCIGPIVKVLKPLGVLLVGSLFAATGLYALSEAEGIMILLAATIYGMGQTFFWPVTLGLVAERFPRGGALTLNAIAGVGMMGVGILGASWLGDVQDRKIDTALQSHEAVYERLIDEEKTSVFGSYRSLNGKKVNEIRDKAGLHDHTLKFARDRAIAELIQGLSADEESTFAAGLKLVSKLEDKELAATLTPKERADAEQLKATVDAAVTRALQSETFASALDADKMYQTLVRNAYDHLIRAKDDKDEKTYAEMHAALASAGVFVNDEEFKAVDEDRTILTKVTTEAKKGALATVAYLPLIMALCYIGLMIYFKTKGGYKAIELTSEKGQETPSG